MGNKQVKEMQLCWDCANASGGCAWSSESIPVPGWTATLADRNGEASYAVTDCPEFRRDAYGFGASRNPPLTDAERSEILRKRASEYNRRRYGRYIERRAAENAQVGL